MSKHARPFDAEEAERLESLDSRPRPLEPADPADALVADQDGESAGPGLTQETRDPAALDPAESLGADGQDPYAWLLARGLGGAGAHEPDVTPPPPSYDVSHTAAEPQGAGREVTCPECGRTSRITLNRRESQDFCPGCDFPLFWTPSHAVRDEVSDTAREALRRLPGTAGRVSVGSITCPHCAEVNPVSATACLRCAGDLRPPPPIMAPPPPPPPPLPPEPEPDVSTIPRWWWIVGGATAVVLVALVLWILLG